MFDGKWAAQGVKLRLFGVSTTRFTHCLCLVVGVVVSVSCNESVRCGAGTRIEGEKCVVVEPPNPDGGKARDAAADLAKETDAATPETPPTVAPPELPAKPIGACPDAPGPAMVEVKGPNGALCIDSTEVTQAQYAEFVIASPPTFSDVPVCDHNTSYLPQGLGSDGAETCPTGMPFDPDGHGDYPVVCADWCDAKAYCEWAGKRLCSNSEGQLVMELEPALAAKDELRFACGNAGQSGFPYGDDYDSARCSSDRIGPVGSYDCEASDPVFNLVGNVAEWAGICSAIGSTYLECFAVGGGSIGVSGTESPEQGCAQARRLSAKPGQGYIDVGFRCCAEAE